MSVCCDHDGVTFPFSSSTLGHLVQAIVQGQTEATMGTLFMMAGVDAWEPDSYPNKDTRVQRVVKGLRADGSLPAVDGILELVRLQLVRGKARRFNDPSPWWQPLVDAVAADGWDFDSTTDTLVPVVPGTHMSVETNWVSDALRARAWDTPAGHYDQAVDSFSAGNWAAANGQLRTFFESLIRTAAGTPGGSGTGQVQASVDTLNAGGLLLTDEAEFLKRLWKMLHPAGSHPGLSDQMESRFRLLTLTGYARFLLSRLR